jgi:UDP-N-acetylglucosamine 2-epimerase (non-hydrolysing)/GDP/UDP-N,N'-diacetylbacillosamine 2-epimerase (hydrolysing)
VVTTTRADYGLLKWVMHEIRAAGMDLQVLVSGTHLAPEFGMTVREIEADGFPIAARVEIQLHGDSGVATAKSMGLAVLGVAPELERLKPDLVLVLGDRYEVFAIASVATVMRIPVGHIGGGDVTEGAFDELFRHGITKLAQLHFVPNAEARNRVLQMGEDPARVHQAGSPGIDSIVRMQPLSRAAVEGRLGFRLRARNLLVTFHPVTLDRQPSDEQFSELLAALEGLGPETGLIFTYPNADPDGRKIAVMIDDFVAKHDNAIVRASLGTELYLSVMRLCDVVVGNSSSGLYEAPTLRRATVNIGDRQRGRFAAASVVNCEPRQEDISRAIDRALALDCSTVVNPYGDGQSSKRIADVLAAIPDYSALLRKVFHSAPGVVS